MSPSGPPRPPDVRRARAADLPAVARLRHSLWPNLARAGHLAELEVALAAPEGRTAVFIAVCRDGSLAGFAETSLRLDYVNGCETSPVAFLEGIWVEPAHRRTGVARLLVAAGETWARSRGCREFASDAPADNAPSHALHAALGFAETERVVFFRKALG